jgi:hypothetical protein
MEFRRGNRKDTMHRYSMKYIYKEEEICALKQCKNIQKLKGKMREEVSCVEII